MATVTISGDNRRIDEPDAIRAFLAPFGIWYEKWDVDGRLGDQPTDEEILAAYKPEIDRLSERGGYVTADVINVKPDTPNLDAMLARFDKEHTHSEDEVRFTVAGRGVFWVRPDDGPVFAVEVESGDLINVPAGTKHWFHLCGDRQIRCIRLFQDPSGWTPEYIEGGRHAQHQPVCWGGAFLAKAEAIHGPVRGAVRL